ncbi:DUF4244 domain-containing protein [Modestobacter roseus]|uniref:Uncharacterized protein DUF4244 n=1 Tax=Modestobacter roseus TaxID=1181884 RepID=A0A562IX93_9ACTN|nr:DUF4244 domain-containing protein [Modestobacter roseus]TWH75577.1 uncharacterized protein DUF4244 [Modestobacter roseus]
MTGQDRGRQDGGGRRSGRVATALRRRWAAVRRSGEEGMSTAEYAVGTVAACAFAAVLYQVVTGGSVVAALGDLVQRALATLS